MPASMHGWWRDEQDGLHAQAMHEGHHLFEVIYIARDGHMLAGRVPARKFRKTEATIRLLEEVSSCLLADKDVFEVVRIV